MLELYPWQKKNWQRLIQMQQQERLPHALLFNGPVGIGLDQFAQLFAMTLLCLDLENNETPCGRCQSCQLFKAGNHPDVLNVEPEEQGKQIKIAQIRELIEFSELKSFSGKAKIAIINPADAMNRSTANALLKTLEEPPSESKFMLLTHKPSLLPITIRSRCQKIDFKSSYDDDVEEWISRKLENDSFSVKELLQLSDGAPLKALSLLEQDELEQRKTILGDLKRLQNEKGDIVQIAASWQESGINSVLPWLLKICHDLIRMKLLSNKAKLINIDMKEDLQDIVNTLDLRALVDNYDFIQDKYRESVGPMNYNSLSLIEEVLIHWSSQQTVSS